MPKQLHAEALSLSVDTSYNNNYEIAEATNDSTYALSALGWIQRHDNEWVCRIL